MTTSILDELQCVPTLDDDSDTLDQKHITPQDYYKTHNIQQPEQNINLKISCSTKPSVVLSSSRSHKSRTSFTRPAFPSRKSINHETNSQEAQGRAANLELRKLDYNDQFSCQSCAHVANANCQICNGNVRMNGNDRIVKFFEYVLEFKVGRQQSYKPKEQKLLSKRNNPNAHCNIYFSTINPTLQNSESPQPKVRFSIGNDPYKPFSLIQHQDKVHLTKDVHFGFSCDQCQSTPIRGPRYHCEHCGDFDMCQECYDRFGHYHQLNKIQLNTGQKKFDKINHLLKMGNSSNLKSSIKNSTSLRSTLTSKTCKSWIR